MTLSTRTYRAFLRNRRRTPSPPQAGRPGQQIAKAPFSTKKRKITHAGEFSVMSSDGIRVILSVSTIAQNKHIFKRNTQNSRESAIKVKASPPSPDPPSSSVSSTLTTAAASYSTVESGGMGMERTGSLPCHGKVTRKFENSQKNTF